MYNTGGSSSDDGNRFGLNLPFVVHDVKFLFPRQFSGILDLEHANCRRFKVTTVDIRGWRIRHPWMAFHHCGGGVDHLITNSLDLCSVQRKLPPTLHISCNQSYAVPNSSKKKTPVERFQSPYHLHRRTSPHQLKVICSP